MTYSRLRLRLNCPYAEHLRYDCLLAPKATGSPRMLGSAVHKGLETGSVAEALALLDSLQPATQEQQDALDIDRATCKAITLLFERVTDYINANERDAKVIVAFEQRETKEDEFALKKLNSILNNGTRYISAHNFSWVERAHFCKKNTPDGRSYYGLEIADYCAFPIKMYFARNISTPEFLNIQPKIYCSGRNCPESFGLKKVP